MKYIFFFLCIFTKIAIGCDNCILDVNNGKKLSAEILLVDNDSLLVSILDADKQVNIERIDVSFDKKNHISFEDYNHDGYRDFSIWHMDEGMGIYKIYRLFIFFPGDKQFKEIKPSCGDEFVNIRVERDTLVNVIYDGNTHKSCYIRLKTLEEIKY